ncbi:MAG: ChbG/HpnK family deacetylase [Bryobacteraceae bacterium]|nr:ChbG/HpnK family deacetylase [Bryobacteraceae bacterium]
MRSGRRLSVNADDFGFTTDVNRGIVEAHVRGILTSTTVMANGQAFDDAVEKARENPSLDIGVHFVLVGGEMVSEAGRALPWTVGALRRAMAMGRVDPYRELSAQIAKARDAGLRVTHVDTHKHTHLLPPVLDAVCRIAEEHGVKWIRRPFDYPITPGPSEIPMAVRAISRAMGSVRRMFHTKMARHGCGSTDHFAGFQLTGRFSHEDVVHLIERLPEGWTEFMVHPGFCTNELRAARTRLKESREAELRALTHPAVKEAIEANGVVLAAYPCD